MSDSHEQRLYNLALATSSVAASLAASALMLVIPSEEDDPSDPGEYFKSMQDDLAALEQYYCALMNYSGVSWDVLATYYGVSRQALHRRMASRAYEGVERAQRHPGVHYEDLIRELDNAQSAINFLLDSPGERISDAAQIWQERRKIAGWWQAND